MEDNALLTLTPGKDCFTFFELFNLAAAHKGLKVQEGASRAYSEPFAKVALDEKLLEFLAARNIKRQPRPDAPDIFTLVDNNHQVKIPGYNPSNYWNFKCTEGASQRFQLSVELAVGFSFSPQERGFQLWPMAHGSSLSPCDKLPNFRMFKTIVESGAGDFPPVAREIAHVSEEVGYIVVSWTDLGLGGIKNTRGLFAEFVSGNQAVEQIARRGEVFHPPPHPQHQSPGDELFIVESAQPSVLRTWCTQLAEYRAALTV